MAAYKIEQAVRAQEIMEGPQVVREYKIFTVGKTSGQVESVEMREA